MPNFTKRYWTFFFVLAFLLAVALLFVFITPEEVVDYIGVKNTYLVAFLLAVFGGISTVTGVSFFLSVGAFSVGGANPFLLGLYGGLGIFISDSIFFFAARYGVEAFEEKIKPLSLWLISKMEKVSMGTVLLLVYVYIGFTPFPNDILMIALALMGVSFKRLAPVLLVGSITIVTLTAYFGEVIFG
jgi:hypothetical protein